MAEPSIAGKTPRAEDLNQMHLACLMPFSCTDPGHRWVDLVIGRQSRITTERVGEVSKVH